MMVSWYLGVGLFILYCGVAWHSLHQAAAPAVPCRPPPPTPTTSTRATTEESSSCFRPLVVSGDGDALTMQLWLWMPHDHQDDNDDTPTVKKRPVKSFSWTAVEGCQWELTLPESASWWWWWWSAKNTTTTTTTTATTTLHQHHHYYCNLTIPAWARQRSSPQPLAARLVWQQANHNKVVVAVSPFHLTRVVKAATVATITHDNDDDDNNNAMRGIPYLKYGRGTPIRVRFVNEHRLYGKDHNHHHHHHKNGLYRADGLRYKAWNATHYAPHMYVDDLALPTSVQTELAPPTKEADHKPPISIHIHVTALSPMVDTLHNQMVQGLDMVEKTIHMVDNTNNGGGGTDEILDEIRYFLADERLYRFVLTQIISYVHMWLEYMAFRDEVRFYRGRKQLLSGVSASTVVTRLVCSIIIFLYLLDGRSTTSWVVLVSMLASCVLEAWKVWKLLQPTWKSTFPFVAVRQLKAGSKEQQAAEYDRIAIKWLALGLYPLVIAWSFYTYRQYEYKSTYSWFISNAANAVYTFGFISLCPQLYVNYRLKSVAHLPWKVFLYKIFNTFIDDAFAFLIEMPWKHRLMTLRDDVVFVMFLVQVYMYRVDKSRTNEFGYSYEEEAGDDDDAATAASRENEKSRLVSKDDGSGTAGNTQLGKVKED
eukprot:scaffold2246_cov162-Amphora_coffeaeformis.AAC.16